MALNDPQQAGFAKWVAHLRRNFKLDNLLTPSQQERSKLPIKTSGRQQRLLRTLTLMPWVCAGLVIFSLFWDFSAADSLQVMGYNVGFEGLLNTLGVAGLIGYGTNYVAIRMLFRPLHPRPVWGQGVIPANKAAIAQRVANLIENNLLNAETLRIRLAESAVVPRLNKALVNGAQGLLTDEAFLQDVKQATVQAMQTYFEQPDRRARLVQELDQQVRSAVSSGGLAGTVVRGYIGLNRQRYYAMLDRVLAELPVAADRVLHDLPNIGEGLAEQLEAQRSVTEAWLTKVVQEVIGRVRIYDLVYRQLAEFDEQQLEQLIWGATREHLTYIQYLGAVLGLVGGLVIWQPVPMLLVLGGGYGLLVGLDLLLARKSPASPSAKSESELG